MEKFLGQDIPEQERWQFLQDNADAVDKIGYMAVCCIMWKWQPHP